MNNTGKDLRRTTQKSSSTNDANLSVDGLPKTYLGSSDICHGTFPFAAQEHSLVASLRSNYSSMSKSLDEYSNTSRSNFTGYKSRSRRVNQSQASVHVTSRKERDMSPAVCERKPSTSRVETANSSPRPSSSSENGRKSSKSTKAITSRNIPNCAVAMRGNPSASNLPSTTIDTTLARRHAEKSTNSVSLSDVDAALLNKSVGKDTTQFDVKRYVNNSMNKKLDRVGLPIGTKVFSKSTGRVTTKVYSNTPENIRRGIVGMPLGSMPRRNFVPNKCPVMMEKLTDPYTSVRGNKSADQRSKVALQLEECQRNRQLAEHTWLSDGSWRTDVSLLANYNGKRIDIRDLKLYSVIGRGEFGEVYFAKLREVAVAVKKMRVENISEKDVTSFKQEVMNICKLNHPNIVTFIGACTVMPDLCIVMEYMQFSLFDAIHTQGIEFTDKEKLNIMQQVCEGLKYLHGKPIAHCDVKPANILMDYVKDKICVAKITDLGLSMMRPDLSLSLSKAESLQLAQHRGTPRYSAPEILRGELLGIRDMMHADVYSLGLVLYEIIYEEEPYHDFTVIQMREDVGERGITPEISGEFMVDEDIVGILIKTWRFQPYLRPKVRNILSVLDQKSSLFYEE